jgi:hypothetical protein
MDLRGHGLSEDEDDGGVDLGKPDQPPPDEQEAGVPCSWWRQGRCGKKPPIAFTLTKYWSQVRRSGLPANWGSPNLPADRAPDPTMLAGRLRLL